MASETKSSTRNSCQISLEMLEIWKRSAQPNGSFLAWMPVEWSGQESCFAGGMSTFSIPSRQPGSTPVGRTSALKRGDTKVVAIWWTPTRVRTWVNLVSTHWSSAEDLCLLQPWSCKHQLFCGLSNLCAQAAR